MESEKSIKSVFIGGIGGAIGSALASQLQSQGVSVAGFGRAGASLERFREAYPQCPAFTADATQSDEVNEAFSKGAEALGSMDAYVHTVGSVLLKPAHLTKDAEWHQVMATNLHSAFYAGRAAVGRMRPNKRGRIIFLSSAAANIGLSSHEAIAAAKGGLESMAQSMAASYAPFNIRVNCVALGLVESQLTAPILADERARAISERMHPVGRVGAADEVASLLEWFLSPAGDWMSGQTFRFDGGLSSILPKARA